jgi:hypothetical protein
VYFRLHSYTYGGTGRLVEHHLMFDVTTGHRNTATARSYASDLLNHPRGLIVGDSRRTGTVTDGIGQAFTGVGSHLAPQVRLSSGRQTPTSAFDTATRQAVELRLPERYGYRGADSFTLFEWLDDDTVALIARGGGWPDGPGTETSCRAGSPTVDATSP